MRGKEIERMRERRRENERENTIFIEISTHDTPVIRKLKGQSIV